MDLRRLSSFLAVVEEQHFGRAATRLFLSPAAVTQHVQQLEREFGTRLLDRGRGPVVPTVAGRRLVSHARTLLAAANAAVEDVAEAAQGRPAPGRGLRVGVMSHGSAEVTPAAVNAFRRARPDVPVTLVQLNFTEHCSALREDRVDVAFVRPLVRAEGIEVDVLTTEQRIVAVSARSPLADAAREGVRIADVIDLPFLRLPARTPRPFVDYLYFQDGERRAPDCALNPHDVLTSVAAGRGAGSGLKSFARYYPWPGTVFVPVLDAPSAQSVLVTRSGDPNPEVRIFRALTVALARELGEFAAR
ncbi:MULTISPECIES: LysR family transcriptional regulator [unclassified Streptomyces]|uniref:LysR substrate-binding domain-containing protein n=1 Tax=unclassified Streptomyces TaxID=2593676 RepID=UPI00035F8374|nr:MULTISPECIES: LysR family transcriptional regulator [unclassified Streptomyces]MYT30849.1 LysR family transcriptional regulator [Streptomyces sp. SID8354]